MNREKMIEALASVIRECRYVNRSSEDIATAVLDLCGPKKLVWRHPSSANFRKGECFHARCATHHHAVHKKQDAWWYNVDGKTYPTLEAAQAAAQAHADAAHWANTPMGDL